MGAINETKNKTIKENKKAQEKGGKKCDELEQENSGVILSMMVI